MMSYIIVCAIAYNVSASGVIWNDLTFYDWGAQQIGGQTYHYCAWETPYFMFHSVLEDSVLYLCADYGNFPEYTYAVTLAQAGDVVDPSYMANSSQKFHYVASKGDDTAICEPIAVPLGGTVYLAYSAVFGNLSTGEPPDPRGADVWGWLKLQATTDGTLVKTVDAYSYDTPLTVGDLPIPEPCWGVCTVTFDVAGGSVTETNREVAAWSQVGELPRPTWPGYMFCGWWTERDGAGEQVDEYTIVESNVTFYAHWQMNYGTLYFVKNYDGEEESGVHSGITYYGYFPWLSDEDCGTTRPGYIFNGWWTKPVGGERMLEGMSVEGDLTVYAHWAVAENMCFDGGFSSLDLVPGVKITVSPLDGETLDADILASRISIVPMDKSQDAAFFKVAVERLDGGGVAFEVVINQYAIEIEKCASEIVEPESLVAFSNAAEGENVSIVLKNAKKGFYYGVAASGELDGLDAAANSAPLAQANADGVALTIAKPQGTSAFFKVIVSDRAR